MKRILLALVAGAGLALYTSAPAIADDVTPAKPVVTSGAPVVVSETTTPARRGIIARIRDRRSMGTVVATPSTTTVTPMPSTTVPSPMPMPNLKPVSGTKTETPMVTTAAYTTTQPTRTGLFSRFRNRNNSTMMVEPAMMPMSGVVPASGTTTTTPVMMDTTMTTTPTRMGFIARMRARR